MKIVKLKLSEQHLNTLVDSLNQIPKEPTKERISKIAKSVLDKTAYTFKKKQLEVQQGSNLFTKNKKYTFSLELVEAHFLEQFLLSMLVFPISDYDKNVLNVISSTINQQLA